VLAPVAQAPILGAMALAEGAPHQEHWNASSPQAGWVYINDHRFNCQIKFIPDHGAEENNTTTTNFEIANPQSGVYTILLFGGICCMLIAQGNLVGGSYSGYLGLPFNAVLSLRWVCRRDTSRARGRVEDFAGVLVKCRDGRSGTIR
jgi:hypothetical protein